MSFPVPHQDNTDRPSVFFVSGALGGRKEWLGTIECLGACFQCDTPAVDLLSAALSRQPAHVVAHGTAAAEALRIASQSPWLVRSLTLIDPDIDQLLPALAANQVTRGIRTVRKRFDTFVHEGDAWAAMAEYTDHSMGRGAWARTSRELRTWLARRTGMLARAWNDQAAAPMTLFDLAGIVCPVFAITGREAPSEIREATRFLGTNIPFVRRLLVAEAGIAAHLTDPHITGPALREFLVRADRQWQSAGVSVPHAA